MLDIGQIGLKLKDLRTQKGLTQDQVADKLFVSRQAVSFWEGGRSLPSIDNCLMLIGLYDVSIEELLCLEQKPVIKPDSLFEGHSRAYIVNGIIQGTINISLKDNMYQFSPSERMLMLKAVKDGKIKLDIEELLPYLSAEERSFLVTKALKIGK